MSIGVTVDESVRQNYNVSTALQSPDSKQIHLNTTGWPLKKLITPFHKIKVA